MKNQLKWAVQHDYACFKTAFAVLRFLARKPKRLCKVQPSTHSTITYFRAWKENPFTLLIQGTDSAYQGWQRTQVETEQLSQKYNSCSRTGANSHSGHHTWYSGCFSMMSNYSGPVIARTLKHLLYYEIGNSSSNTQKIKIFQCMPPTDNPDRLQTWIF